MKASKGFTLIELLIAFSLFSTIILLLYNSLNYAVKVTRQSTVLIRQADELAQLNNALIHLFSQSYPRKNTFKGNSDMVEFIAPINRQGRSELYRIMLKSTGSHYRRRLDLEWWPTDDDSVGGGKSGSAVLLDDLSNLEFSYRARNDTSAIWLSQWTQEQQPGLIRIVATSDTRKLEYWPAIVIEILRTEAADCKYDPVGRICRSI
ncbi:prepilin-type N-terminal cleavage/methylation domain-containing protein [Porticoccaceae bacterium]|nr:prepilin-type N-terminal cleavage/methylation domain-containing protein [Porticoccaceae bacterium]